VLTAGLLLLLLLLSLLLLLFSDPSSGGERVRIELDGLEAIVKTASKAKFFVEFHSACLEGAQKTTTLKWAQLTTQLFLLLLLR